MLDAEQQQRDTRGVAEGVVVAESQGLTSGCGGTGKYKAAPGAGNCTACEAGMAAHERDDAQGA